MRFTWHARDRMRERGITEEEVEQALANSGVEGPGWTPDTVNRWGVTDAGRRLRITLRRDQELIITVVAQEEEDSL